MSPQVNALPKYLKIYIAEQDYDSYTAEEHATWRYIIRQLKDFFKDHAVRVYLEGLEMTGIPDDRIPRITEMDERLSAYGWGAVGVCGFVPPTIFLDFQARSILPIATDMRTIDHVSYTPAPDIVHEAAGHAPIIADPAYRRYLNGYAAMARKAIIYQQDIDLYEAIRLLSDIKENPDTTPEQIHAAGKNLSVTIASLSSPSESALVARMNWWTAEYGLVGSLKNPKIYGAGLLSSLGESRTCLTQKVKKIPLSIDCIKQSYDITEPQPQLFVTESLEDLPKILEELDQRLAYRTGGISGLKAAQDSRLVNTVQLDSGLQMSGQFANYLSADQKSVDFVKFTGPCQLAFEDIQLSGHGADYHNQGFSSPLGIWQQLHGKKPFLQTDDELSSLGLRRGEKASLVFTSGFTVEGIVSGWLRKANRLLLLSWQECTVRKGGQVFFEPAWGPFDMAVGVTIPSVFGGPADRVSFGSYQVGEISSAPGRQSPFTSEEQQIFQLYAKIRAMREGKLPFTEKDLEIIGGQITKSLPKNWLLAIEVIEIAGRKFGIKNSAPWIEQMLVAVKRSADADTQRLINDGLRLS